MHELNKDDVVIAAAQPAAATMAQTNPVPVVVVPNNAAFPRQ